MKLPARGFSSGFDFRLRLLLQPSDLRGGFVPDSFSFPFDLLAGLLAEFFDFGFQRRQARIHLRGAPLGVQLGLLRFRDAPLNPFGSRPKEFWQSLRHQIPEPNRQDDEIRPLPYRLGLGTFGPSTGFLRHARNRKNEPKSENSRQKSGRQSPGHAALPAFPPKTRSAI